MKTIEERLDWLESQTLHHRQLFNIMNGLTKQLKAEAAALVDKANKAANPRPAPPPDRFLRGHA